jgi:hypothetical protein
LILSFLKAVFIMPLPWYQVAVNLATFLVIGRCDAVTYQVRFAI